ncbi:Crp/Fnr family transcriptional regulator [Desulforamulus aquiferis]|uniref:Crp/Fnr family transcriptional regulator n=1 Tax=Desulforamulus aquiferis TaxID=1397668 RepID=A0AAW7Z893_9FIRM|nr:Crp/Fnr family transcriptional regulator [Desulforamulus aquiferis]MDO7785716.1 Crp/Fnr family transcriptional regulator [Desulforamulus aquiferis]
MYEIELTDVEKDYLDSIGSTVNYPKGQIIFAAGQRTNEVYYIKNGWVKVFGTTLDGRQVSVALRYSGDFIGLAEVLSEDQEREYSAEAMDNVSILILWKDSFKKMLGEHPDFSAKIMKLMSDRLRESQRTIHDFINNPVQGRLALVLKNMAQRSGESAKGDIVNVRLRVTQEELACCIGASRQTVSTLLNLLKDDGCLKYEGREIVSLNIKKLNAWIG